MAAKSQTNEPWVKEFLGNGSGSGYSRGMRRNNYWLLGIGLFINGACGARTGGLYEDADAGYFYTVGGNNNVGASTWGVGGSNNAGGLTWGVGGVNYGGASFYVYTGGTWYGAGGYTGYTCTGSVGCSCYGGYYCDGGLTCNYGICNYNYGVGGSSVCQPGA